MKQTACALLAAFGLFGVQLLPAQTVATIEHTDTHAGGAYRIGEIIKLTFATTPSWRDSKMSGIVFQFEPVTKGTASQDFQVNCSQEITFLADGKVSCKGTIVGAGIFADSYQLRQIFFQPDGLIAHWAPITSAPIRVDGPSLDLQKRLNETKFEDASISR